MFVMLVSWYGNDYIEHQNIMDTGSWPDTSEYLEWAKSAQAAFWVKPLIDSPKKEVIRFWYIPSFNDSHYVEIELKTSNRGKMIIKTMPNESIWDEGESVRKSTIQSSIYSEDINLLFDTLETLDFWRVPPGDLAWGCTDGISAIIETNLGGNYRLWANACQLNDKMTKIAKYFEGISKRETGKDWAWL